MNEPVNQQLLTWKNHTCCSLQRPISIPNENETKLTAVMTGILVTIYHLYSPIIIFDSLWCISK